MGNHIAQNTPNAPSPTPAAQVTPEGEPSAPQEETSRMAVQGEKFVCVCCVPTSHPLFCPVWAVQCCVVGLKFSLVAMPTDDWTTWLGRLTTEAQTWLTSLFTTLKGTGSEAAVCDLLVAST